MTGVVEKIFDTEHVSEKFKKRTFVLNDQAEKYPQTISFQTVQDKTTLLDSMIEGQEVEVSFNLRGREWTSPSGEVKYFNTLEAWRIEGSSKPDPQPVQETEKDGGLPF
jgi:hypothetical protein